MAVVRHAGDADHPELDRDVAGDVATALEHLAEDDVVDVVDGDARALHGFLDREPAELERAEAGERSPAGRADRCARGGDDDRVSHGSAPCSNGFAAERT